MGGLRRMAYELVTRRSSADITPRTLYALLSGLAAAVPETAERRVPKLSQFD